jgi:translation elongation factor EF-G
MARRGARPCADFERLFSVMRYEAPLTGLLGMRDELTRLTRGAARHWMALSHYAHVKESK